MEQRPLGRTGLDVTAICLGTMTWGTQNTEAEGHAQMDYALDRGVTFWDTAEMYSVPPTAESYGRTEEIIGSWFAKTGKRNQVVLASKIAGPGAHLAHVRDGKPRLDAKNVKAAVEASLKRLQTDWIDLYQLHWPNRSVNSFGKLGYAHDAAEDFVAPEETLAALADEVKAGRIRHVGLSNETPWGLMRFVEASDRLGLPRPVSIQNPYNLLNRSFEIGLAECAHREDIGLLGYAPAGRGHPDRQVSRRPGAAGLAPRRRRVASRATTRRTPSRRPGATSLWRASMGWTRRRWRSPTPCRGPS